MNNHAVLRVHPVDEISQMHPLSDPVAAKVAHRTYRLFLVAELCNVLPDRVPAAGVVDRELDLELSGSINNVFSIAKVGGNRFLEEKQLDVFITHSVASDGLVRFIRCCD